MQKKIFLLFFFFFTLFHPFPGMAQIPDFSISTTYEVGDKDIRDGDILSLTPEKEVLVRSREPYDAKMYGVFVENPKIVFRTQGYQTPVARNGEVDVNISTIGGPILRGDYITSSTVPGAGQKATEITGYLLGIALENFDEKSGTEIKIEDNTYRAGKIKVAVGIGPASPVLLKNSGGFLGTVKQFAATFLYNLSITRQAEKIIRYIIAALVAIISILSGLYFFGRNVTKGIESIGRNPLAKVTIQTMIILNVILIGMVALGGIILSLVILAL